MKKISKIIKEFKAESLTPCDSKVRISGIPSGFYSIDRKTFGFQNGDLILISSNPNMGRLPLLNSIIYNSAIKNNVKVGIVSPDLSAKLFTRSFLKTNYGKSYDNIELNDLEISSLVNTHILFNNDQDINIIDLMDICCEMKNEHDIQIIIIENFELVKTEKKENYKEIIRILKIMAKSLNIPIIISYEIPFPEKKTSQEPTIEDLKKLGNIDAFIDLILFLYRPNVFENSNDETNNETKNTNTVIIAKNRNGYVGETWTSYDPFLEKFEFPDEILHMRDELLD